MPLDPALSPQFTSADPMSKVLTRLAVLESRVAKVESNNVLRVTPFKFTSSLTNFTAFQYGGGRLWIVFGGEATVSATSGSWQTIAADLNVDLTTYMNSPFVDIPPGGFNGSFPLRVLWTGGGAIPNLSTGTHSLSAANIINATSVTFSGIIIEWPLP